MSLLSVLDAGDDEILYLLGVISGPVLFIISNLGHSKDVGDTLGVIPHAHIPMEVAGFVGGYGASVAAEV